MKEKRRVLVGGITTVVLIFCAMAFMAACAKPAPSLAPPAPKPSPALPEKLVWNVSLWGGPRAFTVPVENWAKDMKELTNGRWEIKLHYGEVLSPTKENIDGLKAGLFQAAMYSPQYAPGKLPLCTVAQLPFANPTTGVEAVGEWFMAIVQHPAVQKELAGWNAKFLLPGPWAPYAYMGKVPIAKCEDLKGVRLRGEPVGDSIFADFGAVLTNLTPPETYTALERGMIDGVIYHWTPSLAAYKLYEPSKYATLDVDHRQTLIGIFVNLDTWNALPEEWRKLADIPAKTSERYKNCLAEDDAKNVPIFLKAGIKVTHLPPEERAKLMERAKPAWEAWVKGMEAKGLPGTEVLNYALAKRSEIETKYKKK